MNAASYVLVPGAINGIDVSSNNGHIDFQAVKDAGFEYVYIQASRYSSTKDLPFDKLLDQARRADLRVGSYHFCSQATDARAQAQFAYRACGGLGSANGDLPPMFDWEFCTPSNYVPPKYPLGHPQHCVSWLVDCLDEATKLWYPNNDRLINPRYPMVYLYPAYGQSHQPALSQALELAQYPLCYASYRYDSGIPESYQAAVSVHQAPNPPWPTITMVQYSGDKGRPVPGVAGACDRQVFCGDEIEWEVLLGL